MTSRSWQVLAAFCLMTVTLAFLSNFVGLTPARSFVDSLKSLSHQTLDDAPSRRYHPQDGSHHSTTQAESRVSDTTPQTTFIPGKASTMRPATFLRSKMDRDLGSRRLSSVRQREREKLPKKRKKNRQEQSEDKKQEKHQEQPQQQQQQQQQQQLQQQQQQQQQHEDGRMPSVGHDLSQVKSFFEDRNTNSTPTKECEIRKSVFHLKVHKTGSSVMTIMLFRLARKYDLYVVPLQNAPRRSNSLTDFYFHPPYGVETRGPFSIFSEHFTYSQGEVEHFMPPSTAKIAGIRHPLPHLRSTFIEFNLANGLKIKDTDPVREFLQNPQKYQEKEYYTKSLQSRYFGLQESNLDNETAIIDLINYIHGQFDIVMVTEYFDESLVLLRRWLCWEVSDILYLVLRQRHYWHRTSLLEPELETNHRKWSRADYMLYDYFTHVLFERISTEVGFANELDRYRLISKQVIDFCEGVIDDIRGNLSRVYEIADSNRSLDIDPRPWSDPFSLHAFDCIVMRMDTGVLANCLKVVQYPELCTSEKVTRKWTGKTVYMQIKWERLKSNTVLMHEAYCSPIHPVHKLPLGVLLDRHAFMGPL